MHRILYYAIGILLASLSSVWALLPTQHDYTFGDPLDYTKWFSSKYESIHKKSFLGYCSNLSEKNQAIDIGKPTLQKAFDRNKLISIPSENPPIENIPTKDAIPTTSSTVTVSKEALIVQSGGSPIPNTINPETQEITNPYTQAITADDLLMILRKEIPVGTPTNNTTQQILIPFKTPIKNSTTAPNNPSTATFIQN